MIKTKKDKINEINTKIKCKSKYIVTQKLAFEVLNSSIRLLCWSKTLLNFTDPVARNVYVRNSLSLTVNSGDSLSASNSVGSSFTVQGFLIKTHSEELTFACKWVSRIVYHFRNVLLPSFRLWANHQQRLHSYVCIRMLPPKIDC